MTLEYGGRNCYENRARKMLTAKMCNSVSLKRMRKISASEGKFACGTWSFIFNMAKVWVSANVQRELHFSSVSFNGGSSMDAAYASIGCGALILHKSKHKYLGPKHGYVSLRLKGGACHRWTLMTSVTFFERGHSLKMSVKKSSIPPFPSPGKCAYGTKCAKIYFHSSEKGRALLYSCWSASADQQKRFTSPL